MPIMGYARFVPIPVSAFKAIAKSLVRFEVTLYRHYGGFKLAPLKNEAGIQSFQSRGTRDWTPAFAGVTGRENVIIFGNCYNR
jgi:hypothetical protein